MAKATTIEHSSDIEMLAQASYLSPVYAIPPNGLAYWWFNDVKAGESVTIILHSNSVAYWYSDVYFSNLTKLSGVDNVGGSHNNTFSAPKDDNYLLIMNAGYAGFNYTIESSQAPVLATNYSQSKRIDQNNYQYWWINNIKAGDKVLIGIESNSSYWYSDIYLSNLTHIIGAYGGVHNDMFVAPKDGNYLLVIASGNSGFTYTIDSTHNVSSATHYLQSKSMGSNQLGYWWFNNVKAGDLVLIGSDVNTTANWYSDVYFSNMTKLAGVDNVGGSHNNMFVAPKDDNYLFVMRSEGNSPFNYLLDSSHSATLPINLTGVTLVSGGSGYTTPHILLVGGGGTGATAVARVSQGVVIGIVLTSPGSGYTSAPTVVIRDPSPRAKGASATITYANP